MVTPPVVWSNRRSTSGGGLVHEEAAVALSAPHVR